MGLNEELTLLSLTDSELRTAIALRYLVDATGRFKGSTEELQELTHYSAETLRRVFRGLENKGFLTITRTKRGGGKYSVNEYLVSPSLMPVGWSVEPSHTSVGTTHGQSSSNSYPVVSKLITNNRGKTRSGRKEIIVGGVKRWMPEGDDTSGDDNIGGFGLFDDEKPAAVKQKLSTDARDPKTRGRRPQEEWTPSDVAAEFAFLLGRKYPYLPGLVQSRELRGALAANRKKYGITAVIEMEMVRLFLGDARMHQDAEKNPQYLHRRFLKMFTTHMDQALQNLGMPSRKALAQVDVADDERMEYVYASDGREFDNSIVGRKAMQRYEEKLKGQ
jgi:hypothetical protein